MILQVSSLCGAEGWFLRSVKPPVPTRTADTNMAMASTVVLNTSWKPVVSKRTQPPFIGPKLPFSCILSWLTNPICVGVVDTHTPSGAVEENRNLAFFLRMWQLPHTAVILPRFCLQPCWSYCPSTSTVVYMIGKHTLLLSRHCRSNRAFNRVFPNRCWRCYCCFLSTSHERS